MPLCTDGRELDKLHQPHWDYVKDHSLRFSVIHFVATGWQQNTNKKLGNSIFPPNFRTALLDFFFF